MLGLPLHGDDVAPYFCSADHFMIAELDGDQTCRVRRLTLPEGSWSGRLERLSAAGVTVLLCGGFNRCFLPVAESLGIRVISGLAGEADRLIDAFLRGELDRYRFVPCRNRYRGRHGGEWTLQSRGRELRDRKGVDQCRDSIKPVRGGPDRARDVPGAVAADQAAERHG